MPRKARKKSCTGVYHVVMRGNNKTWIYQKIQYKRLVQKIIFEEEEKGRIELISWCIMNSHIHLVLYAEWDHLSCAISNINQSFAQKFNYFEKNTGHVFEGRYKSECIENLKYLRNVIRYVHNNPVNAGMVKHASDYPWSSYHKYVKDEMDTQSINVMDICFNNNLHEFINFHLGCDYNEYLDTKDEIEKIRILRAKKIIQDTQNINQCKTYEDLKKKKKVWIKMIVNLVNETNLSRRNLARILKVSQGRISQIYNENK